MEDWGEYEPPQPSLLDGDYCEETTEEYDEGYIPYSLRMLLKQKKNCNDEKILRNEDSNEF